MILWVYEEKLDKHERDFWMDKMIPNEVCFHLCNSHITFIVLRVYVSTSKSDLLHLDTIAGLQRLQPSLSGARLSALNSANNSE